VLCVETIGKIRRWHRVDKLSISQIARRLGASRNTVKKYLKSNATQPKYSSRPKRFPVMGPWAARLLELLREDAGKPLRERRNGRRLYDTLAQEGFRDPIRRFSARFVVGEPSMSVRSDGCLSRWPSPQARPTSSIGATRP
jgi:transposase